MKPSVYLAGPITGTSYEQTSNWRNSVREQLWPDIECFSPTRGKVWLESSKDIADKYDDFVLSTQRGVMVRDFNDCKERDLIFVNLLGAQRVSIGTVMEIAWGYAYRKPIVVVMEKTGNVHDHAMIREADILRVETIDEAVVLTRTVLLP